MPIRDVETFWPVADDAPRGLANRGANGIDGFTSTVIGVAQASAPAPTVGLCGDLCFLHDTNGLLGAAVPATIVVIDNDGGGIFSYLPPAQLPEFEQLFGTPHGLDLVEVARAHGAVAERIDDLGRLAHVLSSEAFTKNDGVRVIVVPVDRVTSVTRHQALWPVVEEALQ
jgi:2-succinyl-5-enolpyruvyl-6-hydroxy-3-cyclohexene-1-carboxylate synthase